MKLPWEALIDGVTGLVGDLVTTDKERLQLALDNKKIDAGLFQGQIDVNKAEAANPSLFIGGWRPAAGWVCAIGLAMAYIPKAMILSAIWTYQAIVIVHLWSGVGVPPVLPEFPDLGVTDLIGLLGSLLGLGVLRYADKKSGTDTKQLG